jgi:hypothetical protein
MYRRRCTWDSVVCAVSGLQAEQPRLFIPGRGRRFCLSSKILRKALAPTQSAIQWVHMACAPGLNQPVGEADHSSQYTGKVKNEWSYTFMPLCMPSWCV